MARKPSVALPFGITWADFDWTPVVLPAPCRAKVIKPVKRAKVAPPARRPGPKFTDAEMRHVKSALHAIANKVEAAGRQHSDELALKLAEELRTKARLDWHIAEALDNYRLACAMARGAQAKQLQRG